MPYVLATRNDDLLTCPDGHREQAKVLATLAGVDAAGRVDPQRVGTAQPGLRRARGTGLRLDRGRAGPGRVARRLGPLAAGPPADHPDRGQDRGGAGLLPLRRARRPTPLRELIRVAGTRWAIEECFQTAKNEAGLDHYQVRTWRAWYAHITLAMLAAGWLAVTRAHEHHRDRTEKGDPPRSRDGDHHSDDSDHSDGDELIPLTANEIRRLLAHLALAPIHGLDRRLSWSRWRRRRQYQARRCHYRRRGETPPP